MDRANFKNPRRDESFVDPDHQTSTTNTNYVVNNDQNIKTKSDNQVAQLVRLFEHASDLSRSTDQSNDVQERGSTQHTITFSGNDEDFQSKAIPSKSSTSKVPLYDDLLRANLSANTEFEQNISNHVKFDTVPLHDGPDNEPSDDGGSDSDHDDEENNESDMRLLRNFDEVAYADHEVYEKHSSEQQRSRQQTSHYDQDQLPLIDEYKAAIKYRDRFSFMPNLSKRLSRRPDPPAFSQVEIDSGFELSHIQSGVDNDSDDDEINPENQLSQAEDAGLVNSEFKTYPSTVSDDDMDAFCTPGWIDARLSRRRRIHRMLASCFAITICGVLFLTATIFRELTRRSGVSMNSSSRLDDVTYFLAVNDYSKLELLRQSGTPQNRAATWIADVDLRHLSLKGPTHLEFLHRYSLAVLYYALGGDDKSGSIWRDNVQFLSGGHICTWVSNVPDDSGESITKGVQCQERDHHKVPMKLILPLNDLKGTLPEEIQFLDSLEVLIVQDNPRIGGSLPKNMNKLSNLRIFSMYNCSLSGTLPEWVGGMKKLTSLGIGGNRLSGIIPSSIGSLTNMKALGLDNNMLSADLNQFESLTNLQYLYLESNAIQGSLTSTLLSSWNGMIELDLSENYLSSTLPANMFSPQSLRFIDLHGNRLTGSIPEVSTTGNNQLRFLALHENELEHVIPKSIGLLQSLTHLDLSINRLASTLPSTMGSMLHLEYLSLGSNSFNRSPIPTWLHELENLEQLSFEDARLHGTIPDFIGNELSNLKRIDLRHNSLTSTIPDSIGKLTLLDALLLDRNDLSGSGDVVCDNLELEFFATDCGGGRNVSIECVCCTACCDQEAEDDCYDPSQIGADENNAERSRYSLSNGPMFIP